MPILAAPLCEPPTYFFAVGDISRLLHFRNRLRYWASEYRRELVLTRPASGSQLALPTQSDMTGRGGPEAIRIDQTGCSWSQARGSWQSLERIGGRSL